MKPDTSSAVFDSAAMHDRKIKELRSGGVPTKKEIETAQRVLAGDRRCFFAWQLEWAEVVLSRVSSGKEQGSWIGKLLSRGLGKLFLSTFPIRLGLMRLSALMVKLQAHLPL